MRPFYASDWHASRPFNIVRISKRPVLARGIPYPRVFYFLEDEVPSHLESRLIPVPCCYSCVT
jgi:hypothetical protein